ncbi:MAG: ABC transporter substrate-binding protein [Elioraea sp.]|nr:ABC transporter substrate-binding protein [Elioraea sp.]
MPKQRLPPPWANLYASDYVALPRRGFLEAITAGGVAAALAAGARQARASDRVVRIGYIPITDATALLVAYAKGFFRDAGLEAERPVLMRGWAPLVESFAADRVNLVHFLMPIPIWMRYGNGFPVKIVAWAHTNGSGIVVGRNSGIASFRDFAGKQVAVPFWYSMHNIVLQYALRAAGVRAVIKPQGAALGPDECNLQIMPPPDMPPALAAGKLDAYIVAEPFNALGELRAGGRMLRFTGDIWKHHPCCVACVRENRLTDDPDWTDRVVTAVVRGAIYASQNKREVARLLSRDGEGYLPVPADVVERAMLAYDDPAYRSSGAIKHADWQAGRIDFQPWPYPSATELMVTLLKDTVVGGDAGFLATLDPAFVARDLVAYDPVRRALDRFPDWINDAGVSRPDPFVREEVLAL